MQQKNLLPLPGPKPHAIVGNLFQLGEWPKNGDDVLEKMNAFLKKYNGICLLSLPGTKGVV